MITYRTKFWVGYLAAAWGCAAYSVHAMPNTGRMCAGAVAAALILAAYLCETVIFGTAPWQKGRGGA